ncbi:MAG: WYL domain-containing protein [Burkholderia gladioli]
MVYWGGQWTLSAWCELRGDFRNFDVARIREASVREVHPDLDGRRLADFLRIAHRECGQELGGKARRGGRAG